MNIRQKRTLKTSFLLFILFALIDDRDSFMALVKFLLFLLPFHLLFFEAKSECPESFQCGEFSMGFPFTNVNNSGCGLVTVDNCDPNDPIPTIHLRDGGLGYVGILESISTTKFLVQDYLLDAQLKNRSCFSFEYLSPLQTPSVLFTFSPNLTLFPCSNEYGNRPALDDHFQNYSSIDCGIYFVYYKNSTSTVAPTFGINDIPIECQLVQSAKSTLDSDDLFSILSSEYTLEWKVSEACLNCFHGGGQCLTDNDGDFYCNKGNQIELKKILFTGGMTIAALTSTLIIVYVFIRRNRANAKQEYEKDVEIFLRNNGNLVPMRYKYSSIKKMTNSFSESLGKGGFGSVYKGQLPDGRLVAVKVLNELNGNGEDFMNEVASISRTSHINIVALLGFCFEGPKRALIFDFMPNGSLEKLIDNTTSSATSFELGWDKLYEIALGVARGLEYLHQGCNTRILHLDIKPQNILLDKNLNPRISDFGLAKLCPNRSSIVSMMVARGTIGYIAPEVFSRNFGEVSYKSDVYSYGMLVLEMVGGRKIIDRGDVDHTSEIYFPHYIYKQLEMDGDVIGTMNEDKTQVAKRNLILVGLWCIQTNPKDRPSMTKVVEMLEGKSGALKIPPKPYLYSPPRSAAHVSSTSQSM